MMDPTPLPGSGGTSGPGYDDTQLRGRVSKAETAIAKLEDDVVVQPSVYIGNYDPFANYAGGTISIDVSFDYRIAPSEGDDNLRNTSIALEIAIAPNATVAEFYASIEAAFAGVPGGDQLAFSTGQSFVEMRTLLTSTFLVVNALDWSGLPAAFIVPPTPLYDSAETLDGVSGLSKNAFGIAQNASIVAYGLETRVSALEQAPAPSGGRYKRVLLGIHAILSGTTFSKAALLAHSWMSGVLESECEVDLYLVGGGGSGFSTYSQSSSGGSFTCGGAPGEVRIVWSIPLADFIDGTALYVGAGGVGRSSGANPGGNSGFGPHVARGGSQILDGSSVGAGPTNQFPISLSDVPLGIGGRTGGYAFMNATPSQGPGAGGGASADFSDVSGNGGDANWNDTSLRRNGASGIGIAGASAPAESLGYGAGGSGRSRGGASGQVGGAGGFPGGGGGGRFGSNSDNTERGGSGGAGVIRLAVYRWVAT